MCEYAQHEFRLNKTDENGVTRRAHYKQVEKATGKRPDALVPPDFPGELSNLWSVYLGLSRTRTQGMNGPNRIAYSEMESWSNVMKRPLSVFDVHVILTLDDVYMRVFHE